MQKRFICTALRSLLWIDEFFREMGKKAVMQKKYAQKGRGVCLLMTFFTLLTRIFLDMSKPYQKIPLKPNKPTHVPKKSARWGQAVNNKKENASKSKNSGNRGQQGLWTPVKNHLKYSSAVCFLQSQTARKNIICKKKTTLV